MKLEAFIPSVAILASHASANDSVTYCKGHISAVNAADQQSCVQSCDASVEYCIVLGKFDNPNDYIQCVSCFNSKCRAPTPPVTPDLVQYCVDNIEPNDPAWTTECVNACKYDYNFVYCYNNGLVLTNEDFLKCICSIDKNCHAGGTVTPTTVTGGKPTTATAAKATTVKATTVKATTVKATTVKATTVKATTAKATTAKATTTKAATAIDPVPYCVDNIVPNDPAWTTECVNACKYDYNFNYCYNLAMVLTNEDFLECICSIDKNCHPPESVTSTTTKTVKAAGVAINPVPYCADHIEPNDPAWKSECVDACENEGNLVYCKNNGKASTNEDFLSCICLIDSNCHVPGSVTSTTTKTAKATTAIDPVPYCVDHIESNNPAWASECVDACKYEGNLVYCKNNGKASTNEDFLNCICLIDSNCHVKGSLQVRPTTTTTATTIDVPSMKDYCVENIVAKDPVWAQSCKDSCVNDGYADYCKNTNSMHTEEAYLGCIVKINSNCHA